MPDRGWTIWDVSGVVLAILILVTVARGHQGFMMDDAYIALRYAINFAESGQLAWNPGERVEGYTNFLFVVALAGLIKLGLPSIATVHIVTYASLLGLVATATFMFRRLAPGESNAPARAIALLALAVTPALAIWTEGGLETVPLAFLLGLGTHLALRAVMEGHGPLSSLLAALPFAMAVLTRNDAVIFVAGIGLGLIIGTKGAMGWRILRACLTTLPALAALGAHMLWRMDYYGEILPLTAHAKLGVPTEAWGHHALNYLLLAVFAAGTVYAGLIAVAIRTVLGRVPRRALILLVPVIAHMIYVAGVGGDFMPGARFFAILVLPSAALLLIAIAEVTILKQLVIGTNTVALLYVLGTPLQNQPADPVVMHGKAVGAHIAQTWPDGSVVALNTAGAIPHFAPGMLYIDMLGLNDPVIAKREPVPILSPRQRSPEHAKGDSAFVLSRQPDFIVLGRADGTTADNPFYLSDFELVASAEFDRCYRMEVESLQLPDVRGAGDMQNPFPFTYFRRLCP
ncbi:MAG: hypothetical protein AAGE80_13580 [Pseudomonadota bacterium]